MKNKNIQSPNSKVLVILGPTSSGKTKLAVKLAAMFNGEIVSADSRQVYRGMDIGTGKDLQDYGLEYPISNIQYPIKFQKIQIPYHLIDVADPKKQFDVARYQKLAYQAIDDILRRGKLPIVAGGSGLYLQAVVDGYKLSKVKADKKLRRELEKLSADELFNKLKQLNPVFAGKLNQSDSKNKRRLIRYVEIASPSFEKFWIPASAGMTDMRYLFFLIGLNPAKEILGERIYQRLIDRLEKEDMVGEVKRLHEQGLSWKRLESFGLEYKFIARYLQGKMKYEEMTEKLNITIRQFASKQMTWFRRWERQGGEIRWLEDAEKAEEVVKKFL